MKRAGVRVGTGTRFVYDGEVIEIVELHCVDPRRRWAISVGWVVGVGTGRGWRRRRRRVSPRVWAKISVAVS